MKALTQAIIIVILAAVLGFGINLVSPNKIPFVGDYRDLSSGEGPIVPPDAAPGDPPFIGLDVAHMQWADKSALFVDARDVSEFNCGTIPGAINVQFDYLPDGDLKPFFDSAFGGIAQDARIITFCSGEECDLSLHLARNMQAVGYTNVQIFFGGAREWEQAGLNMERREDCGE